MFFSYAHYAEYARRIPATTVDGDEAIRLMLHAIGVEKRARFLKKVVS
jgi:hypothetical protein